MWKILPIYLQGREKIEKSQGNLRLGRWILELCYF